MLMNKVEHDCDDWTLDWTRLESLCLKQGWDVGELARRAGISRTTLHHWQTQKTARPRLSTLAKLADALQVDAWQLTSRAQPPASPEPANTPSSHAEPGSTPPFESSLNSATFDRQTNWNVQEVCSQHPELFENWTDAEWDELFSSFGTGGELNEAGVLREVHAINERQTTLYELQVVLETHLGDAARRMIHALYESVQCDPQNQ